MRKQKRGMCGNVGGGWGGIFDGAEVITVFRDLQELHAQFQLIMIRAKMLNPLYILLSST